MPRRDEERAQHPQHVHRRGRARARFEGRQLHGPRERRRRRAAADGATYHAHGDVEPRAPPRRRGTDGDANAAAEGRPEGDGPPAEAVSSTRADDGARRARDEHESRRQRQRGRRPARRCQHARVGQRWCHHQCCRRGVHASAGAEACPGHSFVVIAGRRRAVRISVRWCSHQSPAAQPAWCQQWWQCSSAARDTSPAGSSDSTGPPTLPYYALPLACRKSCRQPELAYNKDTRAAGGAAAHDIRPPAQKYRQWYKTQKSSAPRRIRAAAPRAAPKDIMGK